MKERLARKRYQVSTVYVDRFSNLTLIYNQEFTTSNETLQSNDLFKVFAREKGMNKIEHYHTDNGRFIDNDFVSDCKQGQSQTCCGVNSHHQNGTVEKRIHDLRNDTRKLLIHAIYKWGKAAITAIWLYTL